MTPRAATFRFYIDADIGGLGLIRGALRNDVTYPGDQGAFIHKHQPPPCHITSTNVPDVD